LLDCVAVISSALCAPVQLVPAPPVDEPSEILKAAGEIVIDEKTGLKGKNLIGHHITKKIYGDIYNGTVKSYQYKPKNKYPIVYWVFFEEDQTFVEINSKLILSLPTPLLAPV
jgi:hypothetical protein